MTPSPNYFNAHLREVDESYGRHFLHAGLLLCDALGGCDLCSDPCDPTLFI